VLDVRDDEERGGDGHSVFGEGDDEIGNAEGFDEARADLISGEGSADTSDRSENRSAKPSDLAAGEGQRSAAETAQHEAGNQSRCSCAGGCFRELVDDELAERSESEDGHGGNAAQERKLRAPQSQPTEMGAPGRDSDRRHATQAREKTYGNGGKKDMREKPHEMALCPARCVAVKESWSVSDYLTDRDLRREVANFAERFADGWVWAF
jgi:hypothetical protein